MRALLCLLIVGALIAVDAKYIKSHAKGSEFVFLGKFCYTEVPEQGYNYLSWNIDNPPTDPNVKLAFYDDEAYNWPEIYKNKDTSCIQKLLVSKYNVSANTKNTVVEPRNWHSPRFWYVAAVNCGGDIDLEYEMTFLNSWGDNKWIKQFSCDEIGLEGLYIAYFIFYFIGGLIHAYAVFTLVRATAYHSIVKLLSVTIGLEGLSVFCLFIHYAVYEDNGVGVPALQGIGDILDLMAQLVFIFLLVLIAKGWCITKTTIDDRKIVLIGLGVLAAAYLALFIWENVGIDPATTLYEYQTAPGIIILVLRGVTMLWFIWCLRSTYTEENHPSKRQFYMWFGIAYSIWFLMLPLITIIASTFPETHKWTEKKLVTIMYVTFNGLALAGLQFLLWPTRANEYFQMSTRLDLAGTMPYDAI